MGKIKQTSTILLVLFIINFVFLACLFVANKSGFSDYVEEINAHKREFVFVYKIMMYLAIIFFLIAIKKICEDKSEVYRFFSLFGLVINIVISPINFLKDDERLVITLYFAGMIEIFFMFPLLIMIFQIYRNKIVKILAIITFVSRIAVSFYTSLLAFGAVLVSYFPFMDDIEISEAMNRYDSMALTTYLLEAIVFLIFTSFIYNANKLLLKPIVWTNEDWLKSDLLVN